MYYTIFQINRVLDWKVGLKETSNCNYFQSTGNKKIIRLGKQHTTFAAEVGCISILMLTESEI